VGADRAVAPGGADGRAAADDLPAAGDERDLLPAADRLPVANAAAGLPAAQHRLRLLPDLDRGRSVGARPRRALSPDPGAGGPRREPDRGDHRQSERENRRGSPRKGRIRRRKAHQGPQAAPGHRHPRPDAAHRGPYRQRAGSRRRGAGPGPHHPALPVPRAHLRGRRLPGAARRRGCPASGRDHQAHRHRLRRPAKALGDRAHLRLGLHQPPPRPRCRARRRDRQSPLPDRHDQAHDPSDRALLELPSQTLRAARPRCSAGYAAAGLLRNRRPQRPSA
jgi:hypothetical protein